MSRDDLLDSHVSTKQCRLAIEALHKHESGAEEKRQENELSLGMDPYIWLVLTVKRIHPWKNAKPFRIPIVHPIVDPRTTSICLITKDPQREYKDLLEAKKIKFISRVVGIAKLKGKFKPFEARRMLLKENGLFLADDRVVPLLPGLLGTKFFQAKKQPIPVCLTRKDLKSELERAISSTYMHQNLGTCTSVKIGVLSQAPSQILDNLKSALPAVVSRVEGGWVNIQSFHIKTNSSASLPIWTCSLDDSESGRWGGFVVSRAEVKAEADEKMNVDENAAISMARKDMDVVMTKEKPPSKGRQPKVKANAVTSGPTTKPREEQGVSNPFTQVTSDPGLERIDQNAKSAASGRLEKLKRLGKLKTGKVSSAKLHAEVGTRREILRRRLKRAM